MLCFEKFNYDWNSCQNYYDYIILDLSNNKWKNSHPFHNKSYISLLSMSISKFEFFYAGWKYSNHWTQLLWGNSCPYGHGRRSRLQVWLRQMRFCCLDEWASSLLISHLVTPLFSSFIKSWVVIGKEAKLRAKATASKLCFDQQCSHCEKVLLFLVRKTEYPTFAVTSRFFHFLFLSSNNCIVSMIRHWVFKATDRASPCTSPRILEKPGFFKHWIRKTFQNLLFGKQYDPR